MKRQGLWQVESDQCQYGQKGGGDKPLNKKSKYIANGLEFIYYLQEQCTGEKGYCGNGQKHGDVSGRKAAKVAIYIPEPCEAMAKGIARQHERDDVESEGSDGRHDGTISFPK